VSDTNTRYMYAAILERERFKNEDRVAVRIYCR
jgi:hypothetical protein